jgi:hypothetical protein
MVKSLRGVALAMIPLALVVIETAPKIRLRG